MNSILVLSLISFAFGGLFGLGCLIGHPSKMNKIISILLLPCGVILFGVWFWFVVILGLKNILGN